MTVYAAGEVSRTIADVWSAENGTLTVVPRDGQLLVIAASGTGRAAVTVSGARLLQTLSEWFILRPEDERNAGRDGDLDLADREGDDGGEAAPTLEGVLDVSPDLLVRLLGHREGVVPVDHFPIGHADSPSVETRAGAENTGVQVGDTVGAPPDIADGPSASAVSGRGGAA